MSGKRKIALAYHCRANAMDRDGCVPEIKTWPASKTQLIAAAAAKARNT